MKNRQVFSATVWNRSASWRIFRRKWMSFKLRPPSHGALWPTATNLWNFQREVLYLSRNEKRKHIAVVLQHLITWTVILKCLYKFIWAYKSSYNGQCCSMPADWLDSSQRRSNMSCLDNFLWLPKAICGPEVGSHHTKSFYIYEQPLNFSAGQDCQFGSWNTAGYFDFRFPVWAVDPSLSMLGSARYFSEWRRSIRRATVT